jgi:hypothetical protein
MAIGTGLDPGDRDAVSGPMVSIWYSTVHHPPPAALAGSNHALS